MLHEHDEYIDHYECSKCRKDFLTGAELQKHMKEHNQEERTCPYKECKGLKFKLIKDLNEHVRSEHKLNKLTCSVCNMVFRQLSTRIKHEENHKKGCDEDLVKRDPTSLSPPPIKMRKVYSPQFEAIPIRKQTTKRLTRDEILAKIK
uniref:C2H2-type domain-containing protein n=1 Tax=Caenorhabditis tropicalis TaxID=1561998 RepID=A0A1I7TV99_9PELO